MPVVRAFGPVVAALALILASGGAASATPRVHCGDTLTRDTVLTRNLSCPDGRGLTLADGVTLNLRGHRLAGPGADPAGTGGQIGVTLPLNGTATVVNGSIVNWTTGIGGNADLEGHPVASVRDVRLIHNGTGIDASQADIGVQRATIVGSLFTGVNAFWLSDVTVTDSVLRGNHYAASGRYSYRLSLRRSTLVGNENGLSCSETGCSVVGSRVSGSREALYSFGGPLTLTDNDIVDNTLGYRSEYDTRDVVSGNRFARNDVATSIGILATAEIRDNTFTANRVGYTLNNDQVQDYEVRLIGNTFVRNGDGVYVVHPGTSLGGNIARHNTGWGIYAPGATDLGGNVSRGNGKQPQCVGVIC